MTQETKPIEWSKEKPTENGLYWAYSSRTGKTFMVEITNGIVVTWIGGKIFKQRTDGPDLLWCPVMPPPRVETPISEPRRCPVCGRKPIFAFTPNGNRFLICRDAFHELKSNMAHFGDEAIIREWNDNLAKRGSPEYALWSNEVPTKTSVYWFYDNRLQQGPILCVFDAEFKRVRDRFGKDRNCEWRVLTSGDLRHMCWSPEVNPPDTNVFTTGAAI